MSAAYAFHFMQSYSMTEYIAQLSSEDANHISPTLSEDEDSLSSNDANDRDAMEVDNDVEVL